MVEIITWLIRVNAVQYLGLCIFDFYKDNPNKLLENIGLPAVRCIDGEMALGSGTNCTL